MGEHLARASWPALRLRATMFCDTQDTTILTTGRKVWTVTRGCQQTWIRAGTFDTTSNKFAEFSSQIVGCYTTSRPVNERVTCLLCGKHWRPADWPWHFRSFGDPARWPNQPYGHSEVFNCRQWKNKCSQWSVSRSNRRPSRTLGFARRGGGHKKPPPQPMESPSGATS